MNLFLVVYLGSIIVVVLVLATLVSAATGWEFWITTLLGGSLTVALLTLLNILGKRNARPKCHSGKCNAVDYEFIGASKGCVNYRCKCGNEYQMRKTQSMLVTWENSREQIVPYKKRNLFGRWVIDNSQ